MTNVSRMFLVASAAACAAVLASSASYAGSTTVKGNFVKPPIVMDGGADITGPLSVPDGINDAPNVPTTSGCPLPGAGVCAADPNIGCALGPGSGSDPANPSCPPFGGCGGCNLCVEVTTGPDGITAGDSQFADPNGVVHPTGHLGSSKGTVSVQILKQGSSATAPPAGPLKAAIKCTAKDIQNAASVPVTTNPAGTCHGGPHAGNACVKNTDCKNTAAPKAVYFCEGGDEYNCQIDGLTQSNRDGSPPCGPCLAALVGGAPAAGCATAAAGLCVVATCSGGSRANQACDITGILGCPGGFCNGVGGPVALSGDEVGFFAPAFAGMAYELCPFAFHLGFPFDVKNGAGSVSVDIAQPPISVCLPPGNAIKFTGAYLHEPGSSSQTILEFHTGATVANQSSCQKEPCPDVSLPLPESSTGLPTTFGVGPIIAVTGDLSQ